MKSLLKFSHLVFPSFSKLYEIAKHKFLNLIQQKTLNKDRELPSKNSKASQATIVLYQQILMEVFPLPRFYNQ